MGETPKIIAELAALIEPRLDALIPTEDNGQKAVFDACRYSLMAGGKRLRPVFCALFYKIFGGESQSAIDFACGIEMIHTYSLIHDDLPCMDNSDYRRGRLSNHKVYGYSTAMLAGDALLNRAFEIMSLPLEGIEPQNQLAALHAMALRSGAYGMVGGQTIDLALENKECSEQELWNMVELKTAELFIGACESGCLLAGADREQVKLAAEYAEDVGMAFQIQDDILDVEGSAALLGKPTGEDGNKNTFVSKYGVEKCRLLVDELTDKAEKCAEKLPRSDVLTEIARWLVGRNY